MKILIKEEGKGKEEGGKRKGERRKGKREVGHTFCTIRINDS